MLDVLRALACGRDPDTGELLTSGGPLESRRTKRALDRAILEVQRLPWGIQAAALPVDVDSRDGGRAVAPRQTGGRPQAAERDDESEELFAALRLWRRTTAIAEGVPSYCVAQNRTLMEIAVLKPSTPELLAGVYGIGPARLEKYGESILVIVSRHCEAKARASGTIEGQEAFPRNEAKHQDRSSAEELSAWPRDGEPWTESEDKHLRSLHAAGYSLHLVGRQLGRKPASILRRLVELGVP